MGYRECIKIVGLKNVLLYEMLFLLEVVLNLPYLILREIATIYDIILEFVIFIFKKQQGCLKLLFTESRIISLSKISKKINDFRINTIKKIRRIK